ncbi:MAG: NAD(+) synthase [Prevotella sp.]|nr:NAD(+) synthase [Prevotella sp.]MCM1074277.1 NAD(+) synthase [Ruminococcus sp.]
MQNYGFLRVGAAVPNISIANVQANINEVFRLMENAAASSASVLVLPELCVTGYTCADLFMQDTLIDSALSGLKQICDYSAKYPDLVTFVGVPIKYKSALYNCGAAVANGKILGLIPKSYLPNYSEFYEKRWFAPACSIASGSEINIADSNIPVGTDILFEVAGVTIGVEICEDMWTPLPPSTLAALGGAQLIVNLSASNALAAKRDYLTELLRSRSAALQCAYVYASAGKGESTTDLVYAGNAIIAENGTLLRNAFGFENSKMCEYCDVDIQALMHDRMLHGSFTDNAATTPLPKYRTVSCNVQIKAVAERELLRKVIADPFVPAYPAKRKNRCEEIINIQAHGLIQRLRATGMKSVTIGISGGLDSTLAVLVAHRAFKLLGLPYENIIGVTMPGFGTTSRTYENAKALVQLLGATLLEVSISAAVIQHFKDIHHDINVHNLTYENSQARERTQLLMDISGQNGGMVLGTGDLSELALGWCTYNGDHMSMYGVNASVPKTLVRHLVAHFADESENEALSAILRDIIDTPVSPELIPATADDKISQKTEDLVGPYALHDFFIYQTLRYGFGPSKVYLLARKAFAGTYTDEIIIHWLRSFYRRFFTQQFKRSCMPDGPKVGSVSLSPRGDWRMPSDACAAQWLKECDEL